MRGPTTSLNVRLNAAERHQLDTTAAKLGMKTGAFIRNIAKSAAARIAKDGDVQVLTVPLEDGTALPLVATIEPTAAEAAARAVLAVEAGNLEIDSAAETEQENNLAAAKAHREAIRSKWTAAAASGDQHAAAELDDDVTRGDREVERHEIAVTAAAERVRVTAGKVEAARTQIKAAIVAAMSERTIASARRNDDELDNRFEPLLKDAQKASETYWLAARDLGLGVTQVLRRAGYLEARVAEICWRLWPRSRYFNRPHHGLRGTVAEAVTHEVGNIQLRIETVLQRAANPEETTP